MKAELAPTFILQKKKKMFACFSPSHSFLLNFVLLGEVQGQRVGVKGWENEWGEDT